MSPHTPLLDRSAWCADQWSEHHIATHRVRAFSVASLYRQPFLVELRALMARYAAPLAAAAIVGIVIAGYLALRGGSRRAEAARADVAPVVMSVAAELEVATDAEPTILAEPAADLTVESPVESPVEAAPIEDAPIEAPVASPRRVKAAKAAKAKHKRTSRSKREVRTKSRRKHFTVDASTPLGSLRPGR